MKLMKSILALVLSASVLMPVFASQGRFEDLSLEDINEVPTASAYLFDSSLLQGEGTEESPYLISDLSDFEAFADAVNTGSAGYPQAYYRLTANIDFTDASYEPVGTESFPFSGVFDGNGYYLANITIDDSVMYAGAFGNVHNASIVNLGIENADINVSVRTGEGKVYAGLLCGQYIGDDSAHVNYEISKCYATGSVHSYARFYGYIGGLIGNLETSGNLTFTMEDCYTDAEVCSETGSYASYAGGIVGRVDSRAYATTVFNRLYSRSNVEAKGAKSAMSFAGGVAGYYKQANFSFISRLANSQASLMDTDRYNIQNCINTGYLKGSAGNIANANIGHIVAWTGSDGENTFVEVNNYYSDSLDVVPTNNSKNGTSISIDSLCNATFLSDNLGFDFNDTWIMYNYGNEKYPILRTNNTNKAVLIAEMNDDGLDVLPYNYEESTVVAAAYSASGRIIEVKIALYGGDNEPVNIQMEELDNAVSIVVFLIDSAESMKPIAKPVKINI